MSGGLERVVVTPGVRYSDQGTHKFAPDMLRVLCSVTNPSLYWNTRTPNTFIVSGVYFQAHKWLVASPRDLHFRTRNSWNLRKAPLGVISCSFKSNFQYNTFSCEREKKMSWWMFLEFSISISIQLHELVAFSQCLTATLVLVLRRINSARETSTLNLSWSCRELCPCFVETANI